jgi:hypothetical protein
MSVVAKRNSVVRRGGGGKLQTSGMSAIPEVPRECPVDCQPLAAHAGTAEYSIRPKKKDRRVLHILEESFLTPLKRT